MEVTAQPEIGGVKLDIPPYHMADCAIRVTASHAVMEMSEQTIRTYLKEAGLLEPQDQT